MKRQCIQSALVLLIIVLAGHAAAEAAQPVRLIPLEDFFRNPERSAFKISPQGDWVACLASWQRRLVYVQDQAGDENYRLYAVDRDGSNPRDLTPFENVKVRVIDPLEDIENKMLIGMNRRDPRIFDVYRIDVETGDLSMIAENPGNVSQWVTDNAGRLRVAVSTDGLSDILRYRKSEKDPFQSIARTHFRHALEPLAFSQVARSLS